MTPQGDSHFAGFRPFRLDCAGASINGVIAGAGSPVLLLQGWPQTYLEWRKVAPRLAQDYTVVATDLRGYGDSSKPPDGEQHAGYSKRAMAQDQIEVMARLGFERFAVVGHDRGGRVAHRMTLDHPHAITKLAVLDIVPTHTLYTRVTKAFATAYFHWFFLIQPAPLPETLLPPRAEFFLRNAVFRHVIPDAISEEVFAKYLQCFADPATLHAMCEDYRAAASIDLEHDAADLDRRIEQPLLALWGERGAMHQLYDVARTWRERALDVTARSLPAGHWLPEECPDAVYATLREFLA
jgi:haloacetate dehalogenase